VAHKNLVGVVYHSVIQSIKAAIELKLCLYKVVVSNSVFASHELFTIVESALTTVQSQWPELNYLPGHSQGYDSSLKTWKSDFALQSLWDN